MEERDRMRLIHLGLNIAFYRKLQGKTQEQLAEHVGISAKYLSQIETASVAQPISLRLLVCAGQTPLGVPPAKLLEDER